MKEGIKDVVTGIIAVVVIALGISLGLLVYNNSTLLFSRWFPKTFGAGFLEDNTVTLIGSSSNLVSVPNSLVFADATTTDAGASVDDGGFVINQHLDTGGLRLVRLNMALSGKNNSTSTLYIRQMGSQDGTTYYDIATTTALLTASSSATSITPLGTRIQVPKATTTLSLPFLIDGYKHTRFLFSGDNLAVDPFDGVQAWITATLVEDISR